MSALEALTAFLIVAPSSFTAGFIIGSRYPLTALGKKARDGRDSR
jgi:hypothetical protein